MNKLSLDAVAREQLEAARAGGSGRAAVTVYGGHERTLRQTVIAMRQATKLDEHENPGEATVFVLSGRVRLVCGDVTWEGRTGDLLIMPQARHALEALEDCAFVLTVAKTA